MRLTIQLAAVTLCLLGLRVCSASGQEVRIEVDYGLTVNVMAGGVGASWHAIADSIPVEGSTSHGGSAWGANPPLENETAWRQVLAHADWLGLDFIRLELEQKMYEPERGVFDWDGPRMQLLYRILDWCEGAGADVFLQQMWSNLDWLAYPEFRGDPVRRVHSAPVSLGDFSHGLGALVEHLTEDRGYSCIKWLSINNEPGHSWSWWQSPPNESAPFTPALAAVRAELDRRGISLPISGPDWTDTPALDTTKIDFDEHIGAYDIHSYYSRYDWQSLEGLPVDLPLSLVTSRSRDWSRWAHRHGKPFFLTEVGSMAFGWRGSNEAPNSFPAVLKDVQLVLRGLNVGVDGFNRWSFLNRGDLDGQWQMVETWDRQKKIFKTEITPKANSYFVFGLLTRMMAKHSRVVVSRVAGGELEGIARVFCAALESPSGNRTVFLLNDADQAWQTGIEVTEAGDGKYYLYQVSAATGDNPALKIEPLLSHMLDRVKPCKLNLPPQSLTVLSTYNLTHDDPGIVFD